MKEWPYIHTYIHTYCTCIHTGGDEDTNVHGHPNRFFDGFCIPIVKKEGLCMYMSLFSTDLDKYLKYMKK